MPPQVQPSAIIIFGFAVQFVGVMVAYQYVTTVSNSAAFVWVPADIGFLLTVAGVVLWCRRNTSPGKLLKLAGKLLLWGGLTCCVSVLGPAFSVCFLMTIPTLFLSAGIASVAATTTILNKRRSHRRLHSA